MWPPARVLVSTLAVSITLDRNLCATGGRRFSYNIILEFTLRNYAIGVLIQPFIGVHSREKWPQGAKCSKDFSQDRPAHASEPSPEKLFEGQLLKRRPPHSSPGSRERGFRCDVVRRAALCSRLCSPWGRREWGCRDSRKVSTKRTFVFTTVHTEWKA